MAIPLLINIYILTAAQTILWDMVIGLPQAHKTL